MKRRKSDQIASRKKAKTEATSNPFEVKINRKKHDILGQKSKSDRGLPGVARSKGIKKRKRTLLTEYRQAHKTNRFVDRRIGEKDEDISPEERIMQRFIKQKQKKSEKSHLFSLEDDELTHYGQSLADMDDFDEIRLSSDSEGSVQVDVDHFGGFLTKKKISSQQVLEGGEDEEGRRKSRKEIMEEIVAKSKAAKYEKQEVRRQVEDLLEEVDEEWKEIHELVAKGTGGKGKTETDDFDKIMKELAFEPKGKAGSRLKSHEECAMEDKRKMEKLENERIRRMQQVHPQRGKSDSTHVSADALFSGSLKKRDNRVMLAYKDGKATVDLRGSKDEESNTPGRENHEYEVVGDDVVLNEENGGDGEDYIGDDEVGDDSEDGDGDGDFHEGDSSAEFSDDSEDDEDNTDDKNDPEDVSNDGATVEDTEDVLVSDDSHTDSSGMLDESDPAEQFGSDLESSDEEGVLSPTLHATSRKGDQNSRDKNDAKRKSLKSGVVEKFEVPQSVEELKTLLDSRAPEDCDVIVEKICDHCQPSLSPASKTKLKDFLEVLVHFILEECEHPSWRSLAVADKLSKYIYKLGHLDPTHTASLFQHLLDVHVRKGMRESKEKRRRIPSFSKLMVFKLISILFPTSDYDHPITTPAHMMMGQILSRSSLATVVDCTRALFICQLFLEYESLSKRYVPEVIHTLSQFLHQICEANSPVDSQSSSVLTLEESQRSENGSLLDVVMATEGESPPSSSHVWCMLRAALSLLREFSSLWADLPAAKEIFSPFLCHLERLREIIDLECDNTAKLFQEVRSSLERVCFVKKKNLLMLKQKAKSIAFHEPKFDESFTAGRRKSHSKAESERQKLIHKVRREKKGAIREIRKDYRFLAQQKLKDQMERDAARKKKVREILGDLAMQQADAKAEKRKRKED
jgi:nucleolar protein 14